MMEAGNDISPEMALAHLQWLEAMGTNEPMEETPQNRFQAPKSPDVAEPEAVSAPQASSQQPLPERAALRPFQPQSPLSDRSADADAAILAAKQTAVAAKDLGALTAALAQFEACPLSRTANKLAFVDGSPEPQILIIGDAPAREDDREGKPFSGPEGQLLDRMLAAIGMSRQTTMLTNLVFWHPPGKRNPTEAELAMCEPFLEQLASLHRPRLILGLGTLPAQRLLKKTAGVMKLRGTWGQWQNIPTLVTWHPRELLRTPLLKADAWKDLQALKAKLNV